MTTSEHDVNVADLGPTETAAPTKNNVFHAFRQKINTDNHDLREELFGEAIALDGEGNLKGAKQRFEFILNIWPQDQNTRMALAHLLMSINHEKEALSVLEDQDAARNPDTAQLINTINEKLRLSRKSESEIADSSSIRDRSELISARKELKSLRSAQAQLVSRVHEREVELKRWVLTTASVTVAAFLFVVFTITTNPAPTKDVTPEQVIVTQPEVAATEKSAVTKEAGDKNPDPVVEKTTEEKLAVNPADTTAAEIADQPTPTNNNDINQESTEKQPAAEASLDERFPARVDGTVHTVKQGDDTWTLAYQYYGEHGHVEKLKSANGGTDALSLGQALIIPPLPTTP